MWGCCFEKPHEAKVTNLPDLDRMPRHLIENDSPALRRELVVSTEVGQSVVLEDERHALARDRIDAQRFRWLGIPSSPVVEHSWRTRWHGELAKLCSFATAPVFHQICIAQLKLMN